jgi:hypothetical protein
MKRIHLSTLTLIFIAFSIQAQVRNTDSLTNEPLNTASNIIANNRSQNITLSGYAEVDYNQPFGGTLRQNGKLDVHRLIMFLGYKFNDRTHFVAEIEYEHVNELAVEQAFLNYRISPAFNFRAGLMLIPMGIVNEYHEPTTFNGVERPNLDANIVPTTWREIGIGFSGNFPSASLRYQVYIVNGFNGYDEGVGKFKGSNAFRSGRQKGAESYISSANLSTKVDYYGIQGLKIGLAGYFGKTQSTLFNNLDESNAALVSRADSSIVNIKMIGLDARYQNKGFTARGQLITASVDNTDQYNALTGKDLGSKLFGYYLEAGYDVLRFLKLDTDKALTIFARHEKYNTHKETEGGLAKNANYDRTDLTIGTTLRLANGAVLKTDIQWLKSGNSSIETQRIFNMGVGVWF